MGRLCGGAHEISGIKAPIFLRGWLVVGRGGVVVGWVWVGGGWEGGYGGVGVVEWVVVGRGGVVVGWVGVVGWVVVGGVGGCGVQSGGGVVDGVIRLSF